MLNPQSMPLLVSPVTGRKDPYPHDAAHFRRTCTQEWILNPWSGAYRAQQDISSDPYGLLIVPPNEKVAPADRRMAESEIIMALLAVAQAAFHLADSTEERCEPLGVSYIVDESDFDALSKALDILDELPDDRPGITMDGPGRAQWALRRLLEEISK